MFEQSKKLQHRNITCAIISLDIFYSLQQYAHSASFDGTGRIEFDATSFSDDRIIENNKAFNSFSFEFVVDLNHSNTAGLLYASTKVIDLSFTPTYQINMYTVTYM